ncbi:hypothetical protein [Bradyrhizobium sp. 144]|uniref:hypothetical protein n=1 Tax=Bradyrhizobium sp. 144 TaxID=2782620 RepID=UPI001FF9F679|nr:hypothetical protein [Bradyrhizobium sp. 144]MCK1693686.1 hypothetical protein [Bradyrhizobium sp. 144]
MKVIDSMMVLLPIVLIAIALLLAGALRVTSRRRTVERRAGFGRAAGDPFQYPFGDMPIVPRERHQVARDFRAWGIPDQLHSAGALRRNESDGRPASLSGTAVVLTFPRMLKPQDVDLIKARQHQLEEIAGVFGGSVQRDA